MGSIVRGAVAPLRDWNVVVTARDGQQARARALLAPLGTVHNTRFYDVMVMQVDDGRELLEVLRTRAAATPGALAPLGRVVPLACTFEFSSPEEFERRSAEAVLAWADELAGRSFHVRLHRRGLRGRLVTPDEERRLGELLLDETARRGRPARLAFADPDVIVVVETVGRRAGASLWTREDRARHPLLHLD